MRNKKIAIVGARGIANYGGYETFVSELAPRLVKQGFDVYCSCEKEGKLPLEYNGAKLIYFPLKMPSNYQLRKIIEFIYDIYFGFIFTFKCDVVYFLGPSANIFTFFPRIFGKKSFINMGGVEWKRSKFNNYERTLLKIFFKLSVIGSNRVIIDNKKLITYIDKKYHHKVICIAYGVDEIPEIKLDQNIMNHYTKSNVKCNEYWLAVARLQPDNNIETILNGFIESNSKKTLIIIGNFSCEMNYETILKNILNNSLDKKIIFTGGIYNQDHLNMFRQNCFGYIHAHSIGGTNPSLLEAMVMKNIILAHDNGFNREVADKSAYYFKDAEELSALINDIENKNMTEFNIMKNEAVSRVKNIYNWEKITDAYYEAIMELKR